MNDCDESDDSFICHYSNNFSRIGFAIARRLAEDGASVVISSRKASNVQEAVNEIKKFATGDSKWELSTWLSCELSYFRRKRPSLSFAHFILKENE